MDIENLTVKELREIATLAKALYPDKPAATCGTARPVIVCTDKRGVFFGWATDTNGDPIILERAQMAVYWSADVGGVLGLSKSGPTKNCRISPPCPKIELRGIHAVLDVDPEAVKAWEAQPWAK